MSRGILIGDKNTYTDWGLILTRVEIGYPAPKTNYIDIPHGNGSLDLTETMGGVKYSDRTGTLEFDLIAPPSERQSLLTNIANYVHGKKHTIVLPDDPHYVYHSRLAINNVQTSYMLNKLVINVVSDPYRVKPTATVKELYLVENLIPENARQFESPPWVKYQDAEVSVTPAPIEVFEEGYSRNYFIPSLVNTLAVAVTIAQNAPYRGYSIPVSEGEVYSISRVDLSNNRFRCVFTEIEPAQGVEYFGGTGNVPTYDNALKIENIVVPSGANYLFLYLSNQADELPDIKIERGKIATDWTPAWEDLPIEDKPVSFIETSGGTFGMKYMYVLPNSYDIGEVNIGMKIKNMSEKRMRFVVQQASNATVDNIQVGEVVDIDRVWNTDGYTNLLQLQFRSETNSAGDDISFYAYQPAVYEVHGTTDVHMFDGEVEVNILNEGDNVVPKITTDAEITIKFKDLTFTVNAGTHILTALVLEYGDNIVTISGEDGTNIKFEYTERVI